MMRKSDSLIALAAVFALGLLTACGGHGGEDEAKAAEGPNGARAVTVAPVEVRQILGGLEAAGQLVSREEAAVNAEVTGFRVARVLADEGDVVRQGQPLVELDDTLLRSQIDQATALLAQAEVQAQQAAIQAQRVAGLDNTGALSQEQIDQRRFAAESAKAQAAAQAASLADLKTRATKMTVRAPVGGTVLERTVRPGDLSGAAGQPMFRIARGSLIELAAQVPESALPSIRPGAAATVVLPDAREINGTVRLIGPVVDQQTRLADVRVALPVQPGLRPGGFGTARFSGVGVNVLAVPETALQYDADGVSVYVVGQDNRVSKVSVRPGRRADGYVELIQGPPQGVKVLLGSSSFVLEGDVVRPVSAQAKAPAQAQTKAEAPAGKANAK